MLLTNSFEPLLAALEAHRVALELAPRVWVALSGGADSTALLLAVQRTGLAGQLHATHINHGTQMQASDWAEHCAQLCVQWRVPLDIAVAQPPTGGRFPQGFEAWARAVRYAHWQQLLGPGELLLLGHHADDQIETVALRLLQGRLPLPIPLTRPLGAGRLLRPLLRVPRQQLRSALRSAAVSWIEDPSNQSPAMLRNRVRQALLPALGQDWPEALRRCGALTERLVQVLPRRVPLVGNVVSACGELLRLPFAVLGSATLQGLLQLCGVAISGARSAETLQRLQTQTNTAERDGARPGIHLGNLSVWVDGPEVLIWRDPEFLRLQLVVPKNGMVSAYLPHGELKITARPGTRLAVRAARLGDTVTRGYRPRAVREELRNAGTGRWARASYPLLVEPKADHVLCIPTAQASQDGPLQATWLPAQHRN